MDDQNIQNSIGVWLQGRDGQRYLDELRQQLKQVLPGVFGYMGLQIGAALPGVALLDEAGLLKAHTIGHRAQPGVDLIADPHDLPIANDSINCILLFNVFERCNDPHQVLREVDRVLHKDGHLIVVGLNPYSAHGLKRLLPFFGKGLPQVQRLLRVPQLSDWLSVLNIVPEQRLYVGGLAQVSAGRSRWLSFCSRPFADGYVLKARKRTYAGVGVGRARLSIGRGAKVVHAVFAGDNRGQRRVEED